MKYYEKEMTFTIPDGIIDASCQIPDNITKLIVPQSTSKISAAYLPSTLKEVQIDDNNTSFKTVENCIYTKKENETLLYCYSKESVITLNEEAKNIGDYAFRGSY